MRCGHAHSYKLYGARGLPQGSSLKKKSVSGGSFIRGKSVKEELICLKDCSVLTLIKNIKKRIWMTPAVKGLNPSIICVSSTAQPKGSNSVTAFMV